MRVINPIQKLPRFKFFAVVSTYLLGAIIFGFWSNHHEQKKSLQNVDRNLILSAKTLRYLLPEDFHDRATHAEAISYDEELIHRRKISEYATELDLAYAYTLVLEDGTFYFTAPTVTPEDLKIKKRWYFHPYKDAPEAFYKAVETGTPQYATYQDQWGHFRSVAVPLRSPAGNLYLACADYDISYINKLAWQNFVYAILSILPMFLLTAPILMLIRNKDQAYNKELKTINQQLLVKTRELTSSKQELEKEIEVRSRVEEALREGEERLRQAQKMEAIGTLAGGIAHDFNNILFPILGYTELVMMEMEAENPLRHDIDGIKKAALRARDLVDQILTFSRQESGEYMAVRVQPIVKESLKLIRSTIPTDIKIQSQINQDVGIIYADPTQLHQVVMNLLTNALHALDGRGGQIDVGVRKVTFAADSLPQAGMTEGSYVCLTVRDNGPGIDPIIMDKIFDPFFTTKEKGKGTGLGLSVVHGIVSNMKGAVTVESEPGQGVLFSTYFPVVQETDVEEIIEPFPVVSGGTESILLVDDETEILKMEKQMLTRLGYKVTSFANSQEALKKFTADPGQFDLVITDLDMPKMNGEQLAEALHNLRPDTPILLCTGLTDRIHQDRIAAIGVRGILKKPILTKELSAKIREICDAL